MNGRLMKMELDGNINNIENNRELSEQRLENILKEYPNFGKIYTIDDIIKIEHLLQLRDWLLPMFMNGQLNLNTQV